VNQQCDRHESQPERARPEREEQLQRRAEPYGQREFGEVNESRGAAEEDARELAGE
jgi:hypothetical protein